MKKILPLMLGMMFLLFVGFGQPAPIPNIYPGLSLQTATANQVTLTQPPLAGNYTIGGANGHYAGLNEAVQALESQGVAGPVTFKVSPGIYEEQVSIKAFPGSSPENPVVFEGVINDSTQAVLQHSGDFVLQINGADGLTFRYLTFKRTGSADAPPLSTKVIDIKGGADYITLEHNLLQGKQNDIVIHSYGESPLLANNHHAYRNNSILGGGIGIRKRVEFLYPESIIEQGVVIEGNVLQQLSEDGIILEYQKNVNVRNNAVNIHASSSEFPRGIKIYQCRSSVKVNGNKIRMEGFWSRGISVFEDVDEIRDNYIYLKGNGVGIDLGSYETHARVDVINNIITIEAKETEESVIYEGGIGIYTFYATDTLQIYNNSILIHGMASNNTALFIDQDFSEAWLIKNNIFANTAGGYAMVQNSFQSTFISDYNAYFTTGDRFIKYDRPDVPDLASWQALNGTDEHSIFANPQFASDSLLIPANPALNGAGLTLQAVPNDFFGQPRSSPPDIGAVEFEPAAPVVPVQPIVECISRNKDGSYTATFGYNNPNPQAQTIARGPANRLSLLENAGQPVTFEPGRHESVFHVVFERSEDLSWTLGSESVTAHKNATLCQTPLLPVEPLLSCSTPLNRTTSLAQLGYHNPNAAPVAIAPGRLNRLLGGGGKDLGQPVVFEPGHHPEALIVSYTGTIIWTIGRERARASKETPACSPALQPVQPLVECVSDNGNGTYTAYFGYLNPNSVPLSTSLIFHNYLWPMAGSRKEVPIIFAPGRQEDVFSATFSRQQLEWRLLGQAATASPAPGLACTEDGTLSLILVDAENDTDLMELTDGMELDLAAFTTRQFNIRAATDWNKAESVQFLLSSETDSRIDNEAPYALFGDEAGDFNAWTPQAGSYTVTATAFNQDGAAGRQGPSASIHFSVKEAPAEPMTYIELNNLLVVYKNTNAGSIPDNYTELLNAALEVSNLFYWRNSYMSLNINWTVYVIEEPMDRVRENAYIYPSEVDADLRSRGFAPDSYDAVGVVAYGSGAYAWGVNQVLGRGAYFQVPWWEEGVYELAWFIVHEFHHDIDGMFAAAGHPDYPHNHPGAARYAGEFVPRSGTNWDLNAGILRSWPKADWLDLRQQGNWGIIKSTVDMDRDSIPDDEPAVPLDEIRFGSSSSSMDSEGDGLTDMQEVLAGIFLSTNPQVQDSDKDGISDGEDTEPIYPLSTHVPLLNGLSLGDEISAWPSLGNFLFNRPDQTASIHLAYSNDHLYAGLKLPEVMNRMTLTIDANNDGFFYGSDNFEITMYGNSIESVKFLDAAAVPAGSSEDHVVTYLPTEGFGALTTLGTGWTTYQMVIPKLPQYGLDLREGKEMGVEFRIHWYGSVLEPQDLLSVRLSENAEAFAQSTTDEPNRGGVEGDFLIFPNPASHEIKLLSAGSVTAASVRITDMAGHEQLKQDKVKASGGPIDIRHLKPGMYRVFIHYPGGQQVQTLFKK